MLDPIDEVRPQQLHVAFLEPPELAATLSCLVEAFETYPWARRRALVLAV